MNTTATGLPIDELKARLLVLEEERARLALLEDPRLARVACAIDEEYAELYEGLETLLSHDPGVSPTTAEPSQPLDPYVERPPRGRTSAWLASSTAIGAVILGLATLISTRGDAAPPPQRQTLAPIIIHAVDVPEDTQAPRIDGTPRTVLTLRSSDGATRPKQGRAKKTKKRGAASNRVASRRPTSALAS